LGVDGTSASNSGGAAGAADAGAETTSVNRDDEATGRVVGDGGVMAWRFVGGRRACGIATVSL